MKSKTTHVRVPKSLVEELKTKFPNMSIGDSLTMSYNTSLLKLEGVLQEKDFKDKFGRFLYGKAWK